MILKIVPILNAVGCFFLVAFIVAQWKANQDLEKSVRAARLAERVAQNEKIEIEKRTVQLQTDVDNLKASVDSMKAEAEEAKKKIADGELLVNQLHTGLSFSHAHFQALDQAILERNARIAQLNSSLVATRNRLDQAIAELKKAGAR